MPPGIYQPPQNERALQQGAFKKMNKIFYSILVGIGVFMIMVGLVFLGNSVSAFDDIYDGLDITKRIIGFLPHFGMGISSLALGIILIIKNYKKSK